MKEETEKHLDALLAQVKDKKELDRLRDTIFKRGVEALLNAEMTAHLGHDRYEKTAEPKYNRRNGYSSKTLKTEDGDVKIDVPRDRDASFDPVTVKKHKTMSEEIEGVMMSLYAKGMSTSDIVEFIESTYGVKYSRAQVSVITNCLLEDIAQWQSRPLDDQYAILWIDAIHYKIRQDGQVKSKACLVVLGVNTDGYQDILGLHIYEKESASVWMEMLNDLKMRGVEDVFFVCSDNLKGLVDAVQAVFPTTINQVCVVHQIRNSLKHVSFNDRKKVVKDIKKIYKADNEKMASQAFEEFKQSWGQKYSLSVQSWERNWENLTAFLHYPAEIRKLIYTTNIIESFNASLRKYTKNKKVFPNDESALKSIYLAAMQISTKWQKRRFGWSRIYNQLTILFPDRIKI